MTATWGSALSWRLRRHYLAGEPAGSVEQVVDRLIAVPSWSGDAHTSIGLRVGRPAAEELRASVAEGRMFVTYAFRGSSHLMTPATAAVHLAIRCAGRQWELASWREHYGLEADDWPHFRATVRDALSAGPLTQRELADAVAAHPRYRHLRGALGEKSHTLLKPLGWQGDLCFAPTESGVAFRSMDSIPDWDGLRNLGDAGPAAVQAYLSAYGPAPRDRLHYWLGEGLSGGRKRIDGWIDGLGEELATLDIEGVGALCLAADADAITQAEKLDDVVLIPGLDQWILGAGTSDERIVPAAHRPLATRGANLVLVGGRLRGTWKIDKHLRAETIIVDWTDGARVGRAALESGVTRLAVAQGRELALSSD